MPELFSETDRALRDSGIVALGKSAHEIVFSSATAADDFARFYPDAKAAARVVHFHTAANPAWYTGDPEAVRTKYSVPSRYFIVCNQFWLHKNHGIILDALDLLAKDGVSPHVICTGSTKDYRSPNYFSDLQRRAETLTLTNRFQVLGLVDRFDQIQLIRGALAVIQPSKSEGWSTVVEDARVLGKRVLLSSIPVHCEQNPPGAEFFEPDDAHRLAELLRRAWREWQPGPDPGGEAAAREAGERAQHEFGERMLALATAAHP
jgi:glycosyltransferase involved in cell wall biosynthesis